MPIGGQHNLKQGWVQTRMEEAQKKPKKNIISDKMNSTSQA